MQLVEKRTILKRCREKERYGFFVLGVLGKRRNIIQWPGNNNIKLPPENLQSGIEPTLSKLAIQSVNHKDNFKMQP